MGIEAMKSIQEQLISCVHGQMGDLKNTDSKELGQAIDMIKDMEEAIYYHTITEAMNKTPEPETRGGGTNINYYTTPTPYPTRMLPPDNYNYRDMERNGGYMYYPGQGSGSSGGGGNSGGRGGSSSGRNSGNGGGGNTSYYTEMPYGMLWDPREGRSALRRKMYMEGKEQHKDTTSQLKELEAYLQELSSDITEMIQDASPEERAALRQKMTTLVSKIA